MVLELRGDQVREVAEGLGGVEDVLHYAHGLLRLPDKLVLSLLHHCPRILTHDLIVQPILPPSLLSGQRESGPALRLSLRRVQAQPRILDGLARALCKHQVRVQRGAPAGQEAALDLRVLDQARLADLLARNGVLLQRRRQRVLARARVVRRQDV